MLVRVFQGDAGAQLEAHYGFDADPAAIGSDLGFRVLRFSVWVLTAYVSDVCTFQSTHVYIHVCTRLSGRRSRAIWSSPRI